MSSSSSSAPESTPPTPILSMVQPRHPHPRWLTRSRQGFLLAFAGGVAIVLGLVAPNVGSNGITPSWWEEIHRNPDLSSCHTLGCAMVGGEIKVFLYGVFMFWAVIATLILFLSGSQLLRRRLDDMLAGIAALGMVLVSGTAAFACASFSALVLVSSRGVHVAASPGTPAVPLSTTLALWIGGLVLAFVGGRCAGNALD